MYTQDKNLSSILDETIKKIDTTIKQEAEKQISELTLKYRKETDLVKLENKKNELNNMISDLEIQIVDTEDEICEIEREISSKEKKISYKKLSDKMKKNLEAFNLSYWASDISEFKYKALLELEKKPILQNYLLFKEIWEDTRNIFNLAVTDKERRNIIITFQDKNWSELGINLPTKSLYKNFNIENGEIVYKALPSGDK